AYLEFAYPKIFILRAIFIEQYKGVRRYLVRRFPYKVFYRIEEENVVVSAVVFAGRDPKWIKKRVSEA
ncbi:MAG: hypothetical protein QME81_16775, partial [bacterium]|nr:hypothetical protein [bacterium]